MHVADRVQVDERPDARDEQGHGDAQRVGEEREIDVQTTDGNPREQRHHVVAFGSRARQQVQVHTDRDDERRAGHQRGDDTGEWFTEPAAQQQDQ